MLKILLQTIFEFYVFILILFLLKSYQGISPQFLTESSRISSICCATKFARFEFSMASKAVVRRDLTITRVQFTINVYLAIESNNYMNFFHFVTIFNTNSCRGAYYYVHTICSQKSCLHANFEFNVLVGIGI